MVNALRFEREFNRTRYFHVHVLFAMSQQSIRSLVPNLLDLKISTFATRSGVSCRSAALGRALRQPSANLMFEDKRLALPQALKS